MSEPLQGQVYVSIIKTRADIQDMLVTAVDYGRYEWFMKRSYFGKDGYPFEDEVVNAQPANTPVMRVTAWDGTEDGPGEPATKDITIEMAVTALGLLFTQHPRIHQNLVTGFYDLNDADALMQVIFYGKVVYG